MAARVERTQGLPPGAALGDGWRLLFWTVFARSRNPMALLGADRRIIAVNPAAVSLSGYAREELAGRAIDALLDSGEWPSVDEEWREFERRGDIEGVRALVRADGGRVDVQYAMRRARIDTRDVALVVVVDTSLEPVRVRPSPSPLEGTLSRRELEVVGHVAMGQRAHEIAEELGTSESTVRTHLRNALRTAGARSQAQLVALVCSGQAPVRLPI